MKKLLPLVAIVALIFFTSQIHAQRFLTEITQNVKVTSNVIYGVNISVLTGVPAADTLKMDIYEPDSDTMSQRPVVLVFPTGNFLPAVVNGGPNGQRTDSASVEVCRQFAKRGYVAASISYRLGWNPISLDQNVRTSTLINAAYRGMQDAHHSVRYFNMTARDMGNPFGIDTNKIIVGGIGSGGYVSYVMLYFDRNTDMMLSKFFNFDSIPPEPYIDTMLSGDYRGVMQAPLNFPNLPTYSSKVHFGFAMGGAIGDSGWVDAVNTTPFVAFQNPLDVYAPYKTGIVIVPTTQGFVVEASGAHTVLRKVTEMNLNSSFADLKIDDAISQRANMMNDGYDGLYPFNMPAPIDSSSCTGPNSDANVPNGHPWDWYNEAWYTAVSNGYQGVPGAVWNCWAKLDNPNDPAVSKAYIDTIMDYLNPRIVCALGYPECASVPKEPTGLDEPDEITHVLVYPNPVYSSVYIESLDNSNTIQSIEITDITGKTVRSVSSIEQIKYLMDKGDLETGIYLMHIKLTDGELTKKIVFQ